MKAKGFTLIELIIVIVILGILAVTAAPRFLDLSSDAKANVVVATGAAFESGVNLAYQKGLVRNGSVGVADDIQLYGNDASGQIDINQFGYPAQQWARPEADPRLNNTNDCMAVWQVLLEDAPTISTSNDVNTSDYQATYITPDQCRYFYNDTPELSIYYDSRNGDVTVDSDYSS